MKKVYKSSKASKGKAIIQSEEEDPPIDLAPRYEASFPIFHEFEGDKYIQCRTRDVIHSRFLPKFIIEKIV